jgi:general secretion pathway protein E
MNLRGNQIAAADLIDRSLQAIVDALLSSGKLTPSALERAMRAASETAERLTRVLPRLGFIAEADLAAVIAEALDIEIARVADFPGEPIHADRLSIIFLRTVGALPVCENEAGLHVAMVDPTDQETIDAIALACRRPVVPMVALASELEPALARLASGSGAEPAVAVAADVADGAEDAERLRELASDAPIIRLVNRWIAGAVEARASDIHIEPGEDTVLVRYRIDGALKVVDTAPTSAHPGIVSYQPA